MARFVLRAPPHDAAQREARKESVDAVSGIQACAFTPGCSLAVLLGAMGPGRTTAVTLQ